MAESKRKISEFAKIFAENSYKITNKAARLNDKRFGIQPFFQRAGGVQRQSLDVLRTSSRTIAMGEIPFLRGDWTQSNSVQIMLPLRRVWEPAGYQ